MRDVARWKNHLTSKGRLPGFMALRTLPRIVWIYVFSRGTVGLLVKRVQALGIEKSTYRHAGVGDAGGCVRAERGGVELFGRGFDGRRWNRVPTR